MKRPAPERLFEISITTGGVDRVIVNQYADRRQALTVLCDVVDSIDRRVLSGYEQELKSEG